MGDPFFSRWYAGMHMTTLLQFVRALGILALVVPHAFASSGLLSPVVHHSLLVELEDIQQRLDARDGSPRGALFVERASLQRRLGRFDAAGRSLRCAAVWNGASLAFAQEKCRLLTATGDHARAAGLLDRWIGLTPNDTASLMLRAQAHLGAQAYEAAALDLEVARATDFKQFTIDAELWLAQAWTGARRPRKALEVLDRAVRDRGVLPALIQAAVDLEVGARRFDAALDWHAKEKPRSGSTPGWHARQGDLLAMAGRADDARAAWEAARTAHSHLPARRRCTAAAIRLLEQLDHKLAPSNEGGLR